MPPCGRPRRKQSFQMRHHDRGSPEKPEKGKRQASFWESDKAARQSLKQPRGSRVLPAPCRAGVQADSYAERARSIGRTRAEG
jgi:predicted RNase H-like nuclease